MTPLAEARPAVLVLGADGTVAQATLDPLLRRGARVRALVRRPRPDRDERVEWLTGDLRDDGVLQSALAGVQRVLYVTPHVDEEVALAERVVAEAERAGVRLVFVGVHVSGRTWAGRLQRQLFRVLLPAYRPKLQIGRMVEATSPDAVLLVPSNFFDNDLTFLPEILQGSFPTPLRGCNRVAASDIGEVAARALAEADFPAGTHGISGPETLTGAESAAIWADVLGRPVRYTGDDRQAWEATLCRRIPEGKKRRDWRSSFTALGWMRVGTSAREVAETTTLLGRAPTGYREWVQARVDGLDEGQRAATGAGIDAPHC